jgi:hypothetical protein
MPQKPKQAQQPTPEAGEPIVLFGLDQHGKPQAARFPQAQASLATKAAAQLKLQVLPISNATLADLAARLPMGRVHATGRGIVPFVRRDLYDKLLAASGTTAPAQPAAPASPTNETAAQPVAQATTSKAEAKRPANWPTIAAGHVVIAQSKYPEDGWWEAIVTAATPDMLTLRWRDNPRERAVSRHRVSVGLMYPGHESLADTGRSAGKAETRPEPVAKPGHETAAETASRPVYPGSWDAIDVDALVLAQEDGPIGQWWEAIVVNQANDGFTLRWRDHTALPTIVRERHNLALLHPGDQ